ncbi:lipopolysaccharide assembly protein LapB [uncultured Methanobrevibacter sp.]|uniref:tetratricopeptide repeat protein n=1 Tax=uncultured Methanobrevibacter sp. TaxID=253161 RepID=UPI002606BF00|nr:tetratricopeptide repeat protein [uncultured Methanobrevibacter sp.]
MSDAILKAKQYIEEENYQEALRIARKRHAKDDIDEYLAILDMLIEKDYLLALEEKGLYYQYYDESHDGGDYGEKYFNQYLEKQPKSINAMCDKAMSRFNKGKLNEALELMDLAYDKYNSYSKTEEPRIKKNEVKMAKIELLVQAKEYDDALSLLKHYENENGTSEKVQTYKGLLLQKTGANEEALEFLDNALKNEETILLNNSKADALYDLGRYKEALKYYNRCIKYEKEVDDLEIITNFNYKPAYCEIKLGNNEEAIKYLNKTINMLNEHGRLPKDIETIYQKCSFKKDELMRHGDLEDKEFKQTKFLSGKTTIYILIIIIILYILLKMIGY